MLETRKTALFLHDGCTHTLFSCSCFVITSIVQSALQINSRLNWTEAQKNKLKYREDTCVAMTDLTLFTLSAVHDPTLCILCSRESRAPDGRVYTCTHCPQHDFSLKPAKAPLHIWTAQRGMEIKWTLHSICIKMRRSERGGVILSPFQQCFTEARGPNGITAPSNIPSSLTYNFSMLHHVSIICLIFIPPLSQ